MKNKYLTIIFLVIFLLLTKEVFPQSVKIIIGHEKLIQTNFPQRIFTEPHLSINPVDSNHLLVGAMMSSPKNEKEYGCVVVVSKDNGSSWRLHKFPIEQGADPWTLFTSDGKAIFGGLGLGTLYMFHSPDGGETWEDGTVFKQEGYDHETMVLNDTETKFGKSIFVAAENNNQIFVARSDDNGKSFPFTNRFPFTTMGLNTLTPVILSDGTLVLPFITFNRKGLQRNVRISHPLSWLVTSRDGGSTFSIPNLITENCGRGFPVMAVDRSNSGYQDRLYFVCSSEDKNIYFHYSPDKGNKWSDSIIIKKYTNKEETGRDQFIGIPQVAVNKDGKIGIIWQDRTDDSNGKCQYLYFTASIDGGETFATPQKVSTVPSCPEDGNNFWLGSRYKAGGDYIGLATKSDGSFQVVWSDSRSGNFQLYTANIKVNG